MPAVISIIEEIITCPLKLKNIAESASGLRGTCNAG